MKDESSPTGWRSVAASAGTNFFKKHRSRARSGQLQRRVGRRKIEKCAIDGDCRCFGLAFLFLLGR